MQKWNLIIDVAKCHNCNNCFLACKDEYVATFSPGYSDPQPLHGHKWFYVASRSMDRPRWSMWHWAHNLQPCDNAPCVAASKEVGLPA
ncbi:MAG: hypothetical protein Ct9H300mP16_17080 [Pseudomonadota bacterium]|nr:MAG: hypothetical protein Ct9H300mP16_17080 [Pseudomonadota bacterium]